MIRPALPFLLVAVAVLRVCPLTVTRVMEGMTMMMIMLSLDVSRPKAGVSRWQTQMQVCSHVSKGSVAENKRNPPCRQFKLMTHDFVGLLPFCLQPFSSSLLDGGGGWGDDFCRPPKNHFISLQAFKRGGGGGGGEAGGRGGGAGRVGGGRALNPGTLDPKPYHLQLPF